jgi:3'-phosphoadenosine 5'-phosphosulfate sulfotransferase (PAPS reductase)/FAD synthetase
MAWERYEEALLIHGHQKSIEAVAGLVSGGKDSLTIAHLFRPVFTHLVHANTGTGITATRVFVADLAQSWGLPLVMHAPEPGYGYFDMVYGTMRTKDGTKQPYPGGFPGSAVHDVMYQRLKGRALDGPTKQDLGVYGSRTKRAVYVAGRRRSESQRRDTVPHHESENTVIWSSPIAIWHKADLLAYRLLHKDCPVDGCLHSPGLGRTSAGPVPVNPTAEKLGCSGDCGCLANVSPGEPQQWREAYPSEPFIQQVDEAERALKDRDDIPWWRKIWGWGAIYDDRTEQRKDAGRLCGPDCGRDPLLDLMDPLFHLHYSV